MNPNGNYVVIGHISEDSEPVKVISVDGSIRMVNAGEPVFVGDTVLNSYDFPIKIILINNKSILVGLQQELLMEMSDLDDASVIALEKSDSSIDELVDGSSNNDSSNKDKVLAEEGRLISQGLIERSDNKVDEEFHEISRMGADERQFTKEHVIDNSPAIPVNNPPIIQSQGFAVRDGVLSDGSFTVGSVEVIDLDESQSHIYEIVGGNNDGCFAINPATGDITVVGEIDYENIASYDLSIKVTDNGIPPLTTFKTITIDIEDVNEAPVANPDVATSGENGSLIINVLANDTDVDSNDNPSSSILLSTDIVDTNGDILVGMGEVSISNNQVLFALGSDFDYLGDGEVMDLLIRYQMSDSGGLTSNSFLSITITGTNDQPVINLINTSGTLAESNSTAGLSTTGTLSFTELDSGDIVTVSKSDTSITWNGGDLTSSLSASLMSGFVISNGGWSYSTSANLDFLGKDQTIVLKYNVIATDNSGSANAVSAAKEVIVTITGTNDQPVIDSITSTGALTEGDSTASLSVDGTLSFTELDSGDVVTVSKSDTSITWSGGDLTSSLSASLMSGFVISNGGWSYSTSANLDFLGKDQTIVLKYNVIATDNSGAANAASAAKEVIVTITGTNDQPVIDSITSTVALTEGDSTASLSVDGTLSFTELDSGDIVTVSKSDTSITWNGGDLTNSLSTSLMSGFVISNSGWSYSTSANLDFLGKDQTIVLKYNVIATDDSGAANVASAAKEVIVTITGTNDQPIIDSITSTGALTEGDSTASLSVDGTLSFTELDSGDIVTVSKSDANITWSGGDLASSLSASLMSGFVISNSGWSYSTSANLDFLGKDQTIVLKYNVIATDDSGAANAASAAKEVIVTITGTNDQPVIDSITSTGALAEGDSTASLRVDGTLFFTELDSGDIVTVSKSDTSITWNGGDLTSSLSASLMSGFVTSNGGWSYSTSANLDFLGKDQTIVLKYNVIATDDSGAANAASAAKEVIVTITGTNDQPVIDSITSTGALTEGDSTASLSVDGILSFTELDSGDIVTVSKSDTSITWHGGDLTSSLSASLMSGFVISNSGWSYSTSANLDFLGKDQTIVLKYNVTATDNSGAANAASAEKEVIVTITGTNDQPVIDSITSTGALAEGDSTASLSVDGTLFFTELDRGDIVTVSKSDTSITWNGGDLTSSLSASLMSGFVISNGGWSYSTSANLDFLGKDQTIVLKYNVIATDNSGSANAVSAAKEVIVTITGTNDQPVIDSITNTGALTEGDSTASLSVDGTLSFTELDSGDIVTVSKSDASITWSGGDLTSSLSTSLMSGFVISNGGWSYSTSANLDFLGKDQTIVLKYNVIATDNSGSANAASAAKEVIVTITGTNDQPVIDSITSTGALAEGDSTASLSVDGTLSFTELDSGDVVTVSKSDTSITWSGGDLTSSLSTSLMSGFVTSNGGWSYSTSANLDFLGKDQTIVLKYNVIATDNSGSANAVSAAKEVIVTITGTNDQPVIDSITSTGALTEGDSTASLSVDGTLSFTELDSGDIVTVSKSDASITWSGGDLTSSLSTSLMSGFVISNGGWSYSTSANLDFLGKDQTIVLKYNVIATDNSGSANAASAAKEVIVTITGTNDQPVIDSITSTGAITEGDSTASLSVDGALSFTELDSGDVVTVSKSDTSITWSGGDLTSSLSTSLMSGFVTSNGGWSYSTSANLDFLGKDQTIVLKYNVIATDNSGSANAVSAAKEVIVTITGTNDQPVIDSITSTGALTEGDSTASLSVDGTLSFTELDSGDIVTVSKSDASITWSGGDLTSSLSASLMSGFVISNGGWSYSTSANLDFLGKDQTIVLKYNVTATDNSGSANAASAAKEVIVTITGTNDQPVIDSITSTGALTEGDSTASLSVDGTLSFTELDSGDIVTVSKSDTSITWNGGDLTSSLSTSLMSGFVISNGGWSYSTSANLDFLGKDQTIVLKYNVIATDNSGAANAASAAKEVIVTITGTNDQPVIDSITSTGALTESDSTASLSVDGTLSFTELDSGDIVTVSKSDTSITWNGGNLTSSLSTSLMSGFVISNSGWSYSTSANLDFLGKDQTIVLKYNVTATDNSGAANAASAEKEVIVTITGTNDQPVIDSITSTGALTEGDSTASLSVDGTLSFTELNSGDVVTVSKSDTSITWDGGDLTSSLSTSLMSGFVISNGGWSYNTSANLDFLSKDETIVLKYNVIATDDSGAANAASAAKEVIITITGTNDQQVIDSITSTGALTEGDSTASLSVDGILSFTELDSGDTVTVSKSDVSIAWSGGGLTSGLSTSLMSGFVISNSGWSYSTNANLDFLGKDQTIVLQYHVIATDNSASENAASAIEEVMVTITGTNDQPVIDSITSTGALAEGDSTVSLSVDGTLFFTELDSGDIVTLSKSDTSITWNGGDLTSSLSASLMSGFVISNSGWSYSTSANLDFLGKDQTIVLKYNVIATDNSGDANAASAAKEVIVTITGTNDQPVIDSITSAGALTEGDSTASLSVDGTLFFTELDSGDIVTVSKSDSSITWNGGDLTSSLSTSLMSGFVISNGGWSYSTSANLDFLGKDQTIVLKYNVIATDDSGAANAASAAKEVIVTITGTNDQPVIDSITSTGALTEGDSTASLSVDGTLSFTELDSGDVVTVSKSDTSITWSDGDLTSSLSTSLMSGFVTSNGGWSYSTSANLDFLGKDQTIVLKYNVIATDNSGSANAVSAAKEVIVTITGTNDQPVIDSITSTGALTEGDSTASLSVDGTLSFTELDSGDIVTVSKSDANITWSGGDLTSSLSTSLMSGFVISNSGWSYSTSANLDFLGKDQTIVLKYNVIATDDSGSANAASAAKEVIVTITGTNDQPVIDSITSTGALTEGDSTASLSVDGTLSFTELDSGDVVTVSKSDTSITWSGGDLTSSLSTSLMSGFVTSNGGWSYSTSANLDFLGKDQTIVLKYNVIATDDSGAGNAVSAAKEVIVTITGTNDQPVIDSITSTGALTEGDSTASLSVDGTLFFTELDSEDIVTVSKSDASITWSGGDLTSSLSTSLMSGFVISNSGWSYSTSANLDFLGKDQTIVLKYNVIATDDSGSANAASAAKEVIVTITGTNDQPVIDSITSTGALTEGDSTASLSVDGTLSFTELDSGDVVTVSKSDTSITWSGGDLTSSFGTSLMSGFVTSNGGWSYSTSANLDFLGKDQTIVLKYNVIATDDSGAANAASAAKEVIVTITGTNDQPVIDSITSTGALTEGDSTASLSVDGTLSFTELDSGDIVTVSKSDTSITWNGGDLTSSLSTSLMSGFVISNSGWSYSTSANLDFLGKDQTIVLKYNVTATDNSGAANAESVEKEVTIVITGTNDQPVIDSITQTGALTEGDGAVSLATTGLLSFTELDSGDVVTISEVNTDTVLSDGTFANLEASLKTALIDGFSVTSGGWSYSTDANLDFLRAGQTITLKYNVTATDNSGAANAESVEKEVTIVITGTNDQTVIDSITPTGALTEGDGAVSLATTGLLSFTELDSGDVVTISEVNTDTVLSDGIFANLDTSLKTALIDGFSVTNDGWSYSTDANLDFLRGGQTITLKYKVLATDNSEAANAESVEKEVTIVITGTNDQPVIDSITPTGALTVGDGAASIATTGLLSFTELDSGDVVTISEVNTDTVLSDGTFANLDTSLKTALIDGFSVTSGGWSYSTDANLDFLRAGQTITLKYKVLATDNSEAANAESVEKEVTIVITGTNGQPVIDSITPTGALTEGDGAASLATTGLLSFTELDSGDVVTISEVNTDTVLSDGTFANLDTSLKTALIDGFSVTSGGWSYSTDANLDFLRAGQTITLKYNVTATDNSGAANAESAEKEVTIVITGTNDQPVIDSITPTGALTEGDGAASLATTGLLSFTELDSGDVVTISEVNTDTVLSDGTFANLDTSLKTALIDGFSVTNDGWSYSTDANLDFLRAGQTITLKYEVLATDNSEAANAESVEKEVTIVITGTNDQPVIDSITPTGALTEGDGAASLATTGLLSFTELDSGDVVTISEVNTDTVLSDGIFANLDTSLKTALIDGFSVTNDGWSYSTDANLDFLGKDQTITLKYKVVATDNSGAANAESVEKEVTIVITGTNDAPVASVNDTISTSTRAVIDALATVYDVDDNKEDLTIDSATIVDGDGNSVMGSGVVNIVDNRLIFNPGNDFSHLGINETEQVTIRYKVLDDSGASDISTIVITVKQFRKIISKSELAAGSLFDGDIDAPVSEDITQIKMVFSGDGLNTSNDKVVLGADISLSSTIATTSVDSSFAVAGLSYSYDSGTKTLIITKSDGAAISGSDIETIIESIRLKNTDSEANEGERAITISYIDEAGNEGVSATAIITVSGLGIVGIRVSGLPDGEGVFGEGDVITLTLTVDQVLTLGGGAGGTVMIAGKAFALDSSASASAGNNKLVFTYTVADGDVISEENFKIDNPSTDVSLIDISSANGTAVVFSNETPKFFLSKEIVFGSNLAVMVTDGTKGKTLESTGASNWGSSGVFSDEGFVGDARLGFKMADETSAFMLGFSSDNPNHHYNSIDYALYVSNTTAQIYNSGSLLYIYPDDVAAGDEFIVERNGTDINYYHIGSATGAVTLLYTTSNVDITTRLFVDSSLRDSGSKVVDVNLVVESDFAVFVSKEMVFGSNLAVTVTDGTNGKNLESTGSTAWGNSGVFSDEGFIGDARLSFKLADVTSRFMLGFSSDNPNHDYATVEYALYISNAGIQIYTDGSNDAASSVVAEAGDEFIVERHGTDINYYHISSATGAVTLIHTTSNVDMTTRLFVDSAFHSNGSKVVDVNLVVASKVIVDTIAPEAVDLSASNGVQSTSLNGAGRTLLAEGVKFNSDIAIPESNDITQIKIVFAGDSLDTSNDKVVLGADISLNATIATTSVDNSFAVAGLSYSYDEGTKTLIITKTDGKVIYGSDIETIVESIELKNTHSDANEGERTVEISYLDGGGNESVSAIATIMVGPSIINMVVSNIPDGRKAFIEGDVITLTLTVDKVLTLGGGAEGTVMIGGKTFALDSSASAAAGNNKLVFTYTVADGDIISEENFKIDNPSTDVSLIDISSANGNAVVSNNETPKLFLHREMVFGSNLAVTVTDGTNGKTLESTGSDAWGNSGVFSDEGFIGDGRLSFKLADVTSRFMLGFSSDNPNHSYTTMEYAIYISNTSIQIYTDNSNDAQSSVVAEAGDEFIVERHGTDINYYHISSATGAVTLIHTTSNVDITTRLFMDSAFHSNGSKVVDVNLVAESDSAAFVSKEMVFGSNLAVTVTDGTNGKTLESTGSDGWGNSGVFADEGFIGDARLSFKLADVTSRFMSGFSSDNPNHDYDTIEYALYISHTGIQIYTDGSHDAASSIVAEAGDEFIVERHGTDINYYHISSATGAVTLIHTTSNVDITTRLFADSAFHANGSKVVDVNLVVASKVAVDTIVPEAVDLSASDGVQATSLNGGDRALLAEGVKFNSDIAMPESNDITQIKIVFAGDSLDTSNDKVVLGVGISLNATIATTSVDNSFAVAGLSYSYDAGTKTLIITKTDGTVISGSDIETTVESIELKNTHSDANEGERTVEISYLDGAGNESVSAIATIMVGPGIIDVVVSNIPDGQKAFIEGDIITLTLTVGQALTLGGAADGTVMIAGKAFALDASASTAAGNNKLVFTYTVADGDVIREESFKIDNPNKDVSLTNVSSSANGNAVVFNNETPDLLSIRDMTYSDYAGINVSDGVGGKTFEKTATSVWGNAGVFSDEGFVGDGYLSFKSTNTTTAFMLGFSVDDSSDSYNTIDYALYVNGTGIHVYQSGSWDGKYDNFVAEYPDLINVSGDTYKVERDGTNINYYHTSRSTGAVTLFFTKTGVSATSELFIDGAFLSSGAKAEGVHFVSKNTFAVDAVAPDAVDLSVSDGVQATSLNGGDRALLAEGVKFNSDIAIPESNDITQIKIVFAGDSLDTSNDKVVLGADISLNATIATTSVDNSFAVAGLSYSYDAGTKTLIITKTDGTVISGSDIETIVESIELKNTHSDANEGERTVEISYLDGGGNESVSAIATIMVGPGIIDVVVSNIPDGQKAFIEGDIITLTLTVGQALTLGGAADGTVMIAGKAFALDASASTAAGNNKLVFTYTVADGDVIREEEL
ncbi:MAG: VCBS domain-containing protein [Candidatus Endonucleobacter sp. (ex Gigantidas childressi)]|nr:VCBS domain-containing protein [Candidatus Endonucleobacter sp. (ex Gigantidas childressi)]